MHLIKQIAVSVAAFAASTSQVCGAGQQFTQIDINKNSLTPRRLRCALATVFVAVILAVCSFPAPTLADLFVVNSGFGGPTGSIGKYSNSGAPINPSLITGLDSPLEVAVSGDFLYVTSRDGGTIGKYTTSGQVVNASLVTGLSNPIGIEIHRGNIFVSDAGNGRIGEYTTSGATVNASLVSGLQFPTGLGFLRNRLFVADLGAGTVGEYTTSGETINASLISGLAEPTDVLVAHSHLFVSTFDDGTVGKYNLDGTAIDPTLIQRTGDIAYSLGISGTHLYVVGFDAVGAYTTSGRIFNEYLIPNLNEYPTGIAVTPEDAGVPETDLSLTKTDGKTTLTRGEQTTNSGPDALIGAGVTDKGFSSVKQ